MKIRRAETGDISDIVEMAYEFEVYLCTVDPDFVSEPPEKKDLEKVLMQGFSDEKHYIIVAQNELEKDGSEQVVAMADFWAYPEFLHLGLSGYLNNLFVREEHRGKGIGGLLMDQCFQEANARGLKAMHIPVLSKNRRAMDFYSKYGGLDVNIMLERAL